VGAIPALGPNVPRRDSAFLRFCGRAVLRMLGWRIEGALPDLPRFVIAVAPHTSNWDFVVGAAAMFALDIELSFLGKHTLFLWPLGTLMRAMGGIPVDRRASHGVVDDAAGALRASSRMVLAIAPEGTRKPVARLKSGFVHIARNAGVPVLLATLDGEARCVRLGPVLEDIDDVDATLERIEAHYRGVRGWRVKPFPAQERKKAPPG
jgi:1-acyl-sn-glycerol-3-phosphate acyltransferase